jgi:uncharacterized protein (TIGR02118 family)
VIKVSVFYAASPGKNFDMDYYCTRHMPLVQRLCGSALKSVAVEKGIAGGEPGAAPKYAAIGHLVFESVDAFQASFGPHTNEIIADVPNYTAMEPLIQISEIMM